MCSGVADYSQGSRMMQQSFNSHLELHVAGMHTHRHSTVPASQVAKTVLCACMTVCSVCETL